MSKIKIDEETLDNVITSILTEDIKRTVAPIVRGLMMKGEEVNSKAVLKALKASPSSVFLEKALEKLEKYKKPLDKK